MNFPSARVSIEPLHSQEQIHVLWGPCWAKKIEKDRNFKAGTTHYRAWPIETNFAEIRRISAKILNSGVKTIHDKSPSHCHDLVRGHGLFCHLGHLMTRVLGVFVRHDVSYWSFSVMTGVTRFSVSTMSFLSELLISPVSDTAPDPLDFRETSVRERAK
jgi:hypothetical protein